MMNKSNCVGCHNNYYNINPERSGHGEGCWMLGSAKLIMRKKVPLSQRPPWTQNAQRLPSCYKQRGYVFVGPNVER